MPETATDPLILAAEQADAEAAAAEAEALAAQASATAARARARAAKLRREAGERRGGPDGGEVSAAGDVAPSASAAITEADSDCPSSAETPAASGGTGSGAEAAAAAPGGTASTAAGSSATVELLTGTGADSADAGSTAQNPDADAAGPRSPDRDGAGPRQSDGEGTGPQSDDAGGAARVGGEPESTAETGAEAAGGTGSAKMDSAEAAGDSTDRTTGRVAGRFPAAVRRATQGAVRRVRPGAVPRPRRRTVARVAVAVIVLVCLMAGGFSMWNHYQLTADQTREDEYLNAAREGVIALTTLDSGRAGEGVQRVLDHSTGAFRTDFQTRSQDFTKVVEQSKVATQGEITAAAVESMTGQSAVVLVSAVSRVTNSAGAQQEPRVWRLSVTVTREGSELKMSKVEFVP